MSARGDGDASKHHWANPQFGYGPTPEQITQNIARRINDVRFFVSAFGKVADAFFMRHEPSRRIFVREGKRWLPLPSSMQHLFARCLLEPGHLNEVTVDAVLVWDSSYDGLYIHRGAVAGLRLDTDEHPTKYPPKLWVNP